MCLLLEFSSIVGQKLNVHIHVLYMYLKRYFVVISAEAAAGGTVRRRCYNVMIGTFERIRCSRES